MLRTNQESVLSEAPNEGWVSDGTALSKRTWSLVLSACEKVIQIRGGVIEDPGEGDLKAGQISFTVTGTIVW
ncbi:unnamed protein product [Soboliphyme baturini]|uniref:DUF2793 domain-containing protein n=1 Tax=Soboliphyme baturini TaxID=241478 RepID=A0A183IEG0_9BILA|nr:unnamed protein product [Soboliphyme baturini]